MNNKTLLILVLFSIAFYVNAQVQDKKELNLVKTKAEIKIDGNLDESAWQTALRTNEFINKWPTDTGSAKLQTEVLIMYDDQYLYLGVKAYHTEKPLVIQSLKRDVNPYYSDGVSIVLDPANKNLNGYTFGVNAAGAQFEGLVEVNSASFEWDAKWFSGVKRFKDYWTAEMAIPFNALRFPDGQTHWGLNFIRNDMTNNCFSTWNRVPIQFFGANLNFLGLLSFDSPPKSKNNYAIFPYVSGRVNKDKTEVPAHSTNQLNAGVDAKVALTASMNLDLTVNPDFSQVDVDRQVINLNRFNILFPERRTFFLENSDLFSNRGISNEALPFLSRKIGLTNNGKAIPIIAGTRITGSLNPKLRVGMMSVQSRQTSELPSQNYTVASFDQRVLKRSNIRGMFTNRRSSKDSTNSIPKYNTVGGLEFNFLSDNSRFNGKAGYYQSYSPGVSKHTDFGLLSAGFTNQNWNVSAGLTKLNTNFISDLGFTPRLYNYNAEKDTTIRIGYYQYTGGVDYSFYPVSKRLINTVIYSLRMNQYETVEHRPIETITQPSATILFANRREAEITWVQDAVNIFYTTQIFTQTGDLEKGRYNFGFLRLRFASNFLRPFSWGATIEKGNYFNGTRTTYVGIVKYRRQPWGNFGVDLTYNDIKLNEKRITPFIVSPTIELFFSRLISWTTFIQYNSQLQNVNINSRFQWRFRPMSDIFLVYSDNYMTEIFANKSRGLVLKVSLRIN